MVGPTLGRASPCSLAFFADVSAAASGSLRGAIFLGGVYGDSLAFEPVIALAYDEHVTSTAEAAFSALGCYPALPVQVRVSRSISTMAKTMAALLGEYNGEARTERLYSQTRTVSSFFSVVSAH